MSALPSPSPLHLLRSLLREASYLPDAAARAYFRRYIVARFKAYQPGPLATASFDVRALDRYRHRSFKRRHAAVITSRRAQQQRVAHKGLNLLRRANQGDGLCLQKVLWFAYGRLGRRKYALLNDLLQPDPRWPEGVPPLQQLYRSNLRCLQYFEAPVARNDRNVINVSNQYPRLRAVVTSQALQERSLRGTIKRPHLRTPLVNIWQQPMPLKRAVNNVRRWYAETMTRLLPALPAEEWDRIDALSRGRQRVEFARRRVPVGQPASEQPSVEQTVHRGLAMDRPSKADRRQSFDRPRALTTRYMQRLYARLLAVSCKLEYDETRQKWSAVWGGARPSAPPPTYTAPVDNALFGGVDVKGRLPPAPSKKDGKKDGRKDGKKDGRKDVDNDALQAVARPRKQDGDPLRFPFFAEWLPHTHPMRVELDRWKKNRDAALLAAGGDAP